jgi:hypothetical protein
MEETATGEPGRDDAGRTEDPKVRVNRLRRKAARQGYALHKTRRMDPDASDYGTYTLVPEKGKPRTFASADEVEAFLTR